MTATRCRECDNCRALAAAEAIGQRARLTSVLPDPRPGFKRRLRSAQPRAERGGEWWGESSNDGDAAVDAAWATVPSAVHSASRPTGVPTRPVRRSGASAGLSRADWSLANSAPFTRADSWSVAALEMALRRVRAPHVSASIGRRGARGSVRSAGLKRSCLRIVVQPQPVGAPAAAPGPVRCGQNGSACDAAVCRRCSQTRPRGHDARHCRSRAAGLGARRWVGWRADQIGEGAHEKESGPGCRGSEAVRPGRASGGRRMRTRPGPPHGAQGDRRVARG
jgi:hypothetical protein